jgi:dolichol-phosphate mannosyltransferase
MEDSKLSIIVSIIVPCRNEEANIAACLNRISKALPKAEIVVVDGGSDKTGNIVLDLANSNKQIHYIRNVPDLGKGHAMQVGVAKSTGNIIAQIDADLQFYPEDLSKLMAPIITNQADVVLGTRFSKESSAAKDAHPFLRTFGNYLISYFASLLVGQRIPDILAGMKAWKKEVTQSFALTSNSYSYEIELVIKSLRMGWKIANVPVHYEPRRLGQSSVKIFKDGINIICDIIKFRLQGFQTT